MEPNVVKKNNKKDEEEENGTGTSSSSSNFKLKGLRGGFHRLKNNMKGKAQSAFKSVFKDAIKKIFSSVIGKYVFIVLAVAALTTFGFAIVWYVVTENASKKSESATSSYVSSSTTISTEAKTTYESSGSTVYFTNNDTKEVSKIYLDSIKSTDTRLYEELSVDGMVGSHKISEIPYAAGFEISNLSEFILNADRMNFNRITWKKYDRATGNVTDMELQTDSKTNLKYPKSNEANSKDLSYFVNMLTPLLQSQIIPTDMMSGITTKTDTEDIANFVFQIIDKGYHVIDVMEYVTQNATRDQIVKHYISKEYEIKKYKREVQTNEFEVDEDGNTLYDQSGQPIRKVQVQYGYKVSEWEKAKEQAKTDYNVAKDAKTELTKIEETKDAIVKKNVLYTVTKAYTLKKHMTTEYELKTYSDDDVNNLKNANYKMVVKRESFINSEYIWDEKDEGGYTQYADDTWIDTGETIKVSIETGEHVTTTYLWSDELKEEKLEERFYTADDVAEFVSEMDTTGTESSESTETNSASTSSNTIVKASELFSSSENSYYSGLANSEELTRIDLINAVPSIYNDYMYAGQNYSEYIGINRSYLVASYSLLNKHIPDDEATISYSKLLNQSLGMNYLVGLSIGEDFMWPLPLDGSGRQTVTECAGGRVNPITHVAQSYHGAMDVGAEGGTYIYAAQKGTVYEVNSGDSYGNYVVLKHDFGGDYVFYTRYAHMNSNSATNVLMLKVGQEVEAGQVIGFVGTTGHSTGNHLHFEIYCYPRGTRFDGTDDQNIRLEPIYYLKKETVPQQVLNDEFWLRESSCSDITNESWGKNSGSSDDTTSDEESSGSE